MPRSSAGIRLANAAHNNASRAHANTMMRARRNSFDFEATPTNGSRSRCAAAAATSNTLSIVDIAAATKAVRITAPNTGPTTSACPSSHGTIASVRAATSGGKSYARASNPIGNSNRYVTATISVTHNRPCFAELLERSP